MRIRRLSVKNFGKFESYAVDFKGNLAVINGQNEAGKSTIFDMIKLLLFGMSENSTQKDRMRYIRHGSNEAYISGEFERSDGTPLTLSRRISRYSCDLNVNQNFNFQNLGNVTAPIASHLTREVYENIYALDFHTMSAIRDDVWQGIKDEFMGADMAQELVSANDAIYYAREIAEDIYRQDGRASEITDLENQRKQLSNMLYSSQQKQKTALSNYLDLEVLKREVMDKQNQIEFENAFISEADKMNGLRNDIAKIRTLAKEAGDLSKYKKWLPNIKDEYERLKRDAISIEELLEQAKSIPKDNEDSNLPKLDEVYAKMIEYKDAIEALSYQKPDEEKVEMIKAAKAELDAARENWINALDEMLVEDASEKETIEALTKINSEELSSCLNDFLDCKNELKENEEEDDEPIPSTTRTFFFVFAFIMSILLVLTGATLFLSDSILGWLQSNEELANWFEANIMLLDGLPITKMITASIVCGVGLILLIVDFVFIKEGSKKTKLKKQEEHIECLQEEQEELREEFCDNLCGLPIPDSRIKKIDSTIVDDVNDLKELWQKLYNAQASYNEYENSQDILKAYRKSGDDANKINNFAVMLLPSPYSSPEKNLFALQSLLGEAKEAKLILDEEIAKIRKMQEEKNSADLRLMEDREYKYNQAMSAYNELVAVLGSSPEQALDGIEERHNKLNKAIILRDDILSKHPDFKEIADHLSQLDQAGWPYSDEAVSSAKERIRILRGDIAERQSSIGVMENGIKQALLGDMPTDIASEIIKLDKKILEYKNDHDKLRLSELIIRKGHDTFSKLHQPEVLARAGYYLSILTGSKYSELELNQDTSAITVKVESGEFMTPHAARLSQATCEQIYLSLRLSVIESFDTNTEVMPIILDEALITWDAERLTSGLDLLAQIARKRQILIFTCHDFIVDILRDNQPTAQIIDLMHEN
jgi:uncharacterized protein YhaN